MGKWTVGDGVTSKYGTCNLCGKTDCLAPVHSLHMCPKCLKAGYWTSKDIQIERSGICSVCGCNYVGAGVSIQSAWVCFRCLWGKLAHKKNALRVQGRRIV